MKRQGVIWYFSSTWTIRCLTTIDQRDLYHHLARGYGPRARERYIAIFEELRKEIGYADYLGALERYRLEHVHDPDYYVLQTGWWNTVADRLYPHVFEVIQRVKRWGQVVILSDGDAVFQPRKICRSGLWQAFGGRVLVFHPQRRDAADVERMYPAHHYVMIDDKLRILEAIKKMWKSRVTTVFLKQGRYAHRSENPEFLPPADIKIKPYRDIAGCRRSVLVHT